MQHYLKENKGLSKRRKWLDKTFSNKVEMSQKLGLSRPVVYKMYKDPSFFFKYFPTMCLCLKKSPQELITEIYGYTKSRDGV